MLNNKSPFLWTMPPVWLRFFIVILLFFGIFFRFVNLDQKVYWIDEAFTSLRVSGYTEAEVVQELSNAGIVGIESLQKYQRPNSDKGIIGTINSLAIEDPHHPPLYYLIARFWAQCFGNSVAVMRTLPALFSLLALPCIYWLCLELFESTLTAPLTGWVAVALLAISPFQVLYAQESREYSLWTVTILASSLALLRARRLKTKASWFIYAVTLTLSLYTFLFSALVALGHGIYIVALERFRLTKVLISYLLALLAGMLLFSPWLIVFIT
ncbi:MAG: glycosyltransferase family 39 protein, partial [Cyanobacteriota bacterium]|nr:glycosyltransferase family 39 protein [Cyanobacteriota bacterium]